MAKSVYIAFDKEGDSTILDDRTKLNEFLTPDVAPNVERIYRATPIEFRVVAEVKLGAPRKPRKDKGKNAKVDSKATAE